MKNAINYFYNLYIDDIYKKDKLYYFDYYGHHYVFLLYEGDTNILNDVYKLHNNLLENNIYVHKIILNKDDSIVTLVNDSPYILLKTNHYKGHISYNNVLSFINLFVNKDMNRNSLLERIYPSDLWENKSDYMEYQMSEFGLNHPMLRDSFSYYIGLGETAIQLLNSLNINSIPKVISHTRINCNDKLFDLYNPLNLIIDTRVRDVSEYFKNCFFNNIDISSDLNSFIQNNDLSKTEHLIFLSRMLYPTYYFDIFEKILAKKLDDVAIKKITSLTNDYEQLLKNIYFYYRKKFNINPIEWLEIR